MQFSDEIVTLAARAEQDLAPHFARVDRIAFENTSRIMALFREFRVSDTMFGTTSGYGYDDRGRDTLDAIWARAMGTEAAFVRQQIVSGTQALTIGLFGLLRPGDVMLSVAGKPYDTLEEVIGIAGESGNGSLRDFGVEYGQVELSAAGQLDFPAIKAAMDAAGARLKVVFVQRSKGYLNRRTLTVAEIGELVTFVKQHAPDVLIPQWKNGFVG